MNPLIARAPQIIAYYESGVGMHHENHNVIA